MARLAKTIEDQLLSENPEMRARFMRPEVVWVLDTEAPGFREEMKRQSLAIKNSPGEKEILDWIEQVAEWPDD